MKPMAKETVVRTPTGKALEDLMVETTYAFFLIRAEGSRIGTYMPSGSYWGMLRSLKLEGPQTVPQIARSRPVPRQSIQKLADEMAKVGLIEFVNNPAHKRSKFLRLTSEGETAFQEMTERIAQEVEHLAQQFSQETDITELQTAVSVMKRLSATLKKIVSEQGGLNQN